jgi:hypothetical protein
MACCGVVLQGKAWQFKEFPFKGAAQGDMVDTFSNIFGAFFYYKDDKVGSRVKGLDQYVCVQFCVLYDTIRAFALSYLAHGRTPRVSFHCCQQCCSLTLVAPLRLSCGQHRRAASSHIAAALTAMLC